MVNEMDETRKKLKVLLDAAGIDMATASRMVGKNHAYIQQYIKKKSPKELPHDVRRKLADTLGCHPDDLVDSSPEVEPIRMATTQNNRSETTKTVQFESHMALYSLAPADKEGFYVVESTGYTERPAPLYGASRAYSFYVYDNAMEPRYFVGEILYINPDKPVQNGDFVAITIDGTKGPNRLLVARLIKRDSVSVIVEQINRDGVIELRKAAVTAIDKIVLSGEG